uniref:Uncharacterized protein n=1 Tax=Anguilla anguilla TaxID=7936 RepID=A0A0E9T0L1_ANGAN
MAWCIDLMKPTKFCSSAGNLNVIWRLDSLVRELQQEMPLSFELRFMLLDSDTMSICAGYVENHKPLGSKTNSDRKL